MQADIVGLGRWQRYEDISITSPKSHSVVGICFSLPLLLSCMHMHTCILNEHWNEHILFSWQHKQMHKTTVAHKHTFLKNTHSVWERRLKFMYAWTQPHERSCTFPTADLNQDILFVLSENEFGYAFYSDMKRQIPPKWIPVSSWVLECRPLPGAGAQRV